VPTDPTTASAADLVNAETDARFALAYHVTHKLNMSDPKDVALVPAWNQIHAVVLAEAASPGGLTVTSNKPEVVTAIKDMGVAQTAAVAHLNAAASTGDPKHAQVAAAAMAVSDTRAAQGAAHQPPSVDPAVAQAVAHSVASTPTRTAADHVKVIAAAKAPANAVAHHEHAAQSPPAISTVDPSWWDRLRGEAGDIAHKVVSVFVPSGAAPSSPAGPTPAADAATPVEGMSKGEKAGLAVGAVALIGLVVFASSHGKR
jgi:hypothetical protein